jgi:hypothetical protein
MLTIDRKIAGMKKDENIICGYYCTFESIDDAFKSFMVITDINLYFMNPYATKTHKKIPLKDVSRLNSKSDRLLIINCPQEECKIKFPCKAEAADTAEIIIKKAKDMYSKIRAGLDSRVTDRELYTRTKKIIETGQMDAALREASVILEERLRNMHPESKSLYGHKLIEKTLHPESGYIKLSENLSEREGIYLLTSGLFKWFRNPVIHHSMDISPEEALETLKFFNLMLRILKKKGKIADPTSNTSDVISESRDPKALTQK